MSSFQSNAELFRMFREEESIRTRCWQFRKLNRRDFACVDRWLTALVEKFSYSHDALRGI